jgi:hypothetical protein
MPLPVEQVRDARELLDDATRMFARAWRLDQCSQHCNVRDHAALLCEFDRLFSTASGIARSQVSSLVHCYPFASSDRVAKTRGCQDLARVMATLQSVGCYLKSVVSQPQPDVIAAQKPS